MNHCLLIVALCAGLFGFGVTDGQFCRSRAETCPYNQLCCTSECVFAASCVGYRCHVDKDCNLNDDKDLHVGYLSCCKNKCQHRCYDPVAAIVGGVVGGVVFLVLVGVFIWWIHRRRMRRDRGQGSVQQQTQTTTTYPGQQPDMMHPPEGSRGYVPMKEVPGGTENPPPYPNIIT